MRKSLQIYLKQIFVDTEWEERDASNMDDVKAQFVTSSLLDEKQVNNAMARIAAKKETIGLNLDFNVFPSRLNPGKYRVVCNLKKELNKHNLEEITEFLNTVYGDSDNECPENPMRWGVEKSSEGYSITMHGPSCYIIPAIFQKKNLGPSTQEFIFGTSSITTDTDHPCKQRVIELAKAGVKDEVHKYHTIYYWSKESINELYALMLNHKKTVTYTGRNISSEVAVAALSDIDILPSEMRYQVGFFLNLADAGVLAQVKNDSQNALREAKVYCEKEEQQSALSM
ncbi:hypothetical protein [Legionella maioricensis]|uniref:Uncharacterized protein n=1 Tax=Legionella maioricensis TaxID=2896528 RepID=A0A9X2IDK1_9GAMM|nr:hypothetical protein [Legionella maioricensis]MCL9684863.1 hypothetical protein [Legionella maioricensis]MCL9688939.1 hypothetical protein [Legionella maioricensis]